MIFFYIWIIGFMIGMIFCNIDYYFYCYKNADTSERPQNGSFLSLVTDVFLILPIAAAFWPVAIPWVIRNIIQDQSWRL